MNLATYIILLVISITALALSWWLDLRSRRSNARATFLLAESDKRLNEANLHLTARFHLQQAKLALIESGIKVEGDNIAPLIMQIAAQRTTEPSGWIPVTERLPPFMDSVIVFGVLEGESAPDCHEAFSCIREQAKFSSVRSEDGITDMHISCVTHWMPMPEAPKQ